MKLIDTPNPNAKKIETKSENIDWDAINQDIVDIFDKL